MNQQDLTNQIEQLAQDWCQKEGCPIEGACVVYTAAAMKVLLHNRLDAIPQAGTASFRFIPQDQDDGVLPTHFTYLFSSREAVQAIAKGMIPEMHAWVVLKTPEENFLVDLTTPYQPLRCKQLHGYDWKMPQPQPLWTPLNKHQWPEEYSYRAHEMACQLITRYVSELWRKYLS